MTDNFPIGIWNNNCIIFNILMNTNLYGLNEIVLLMYAVIWMFRLYKIPHFEALCDNLYFVINLVISTFELRFIKQVSDQT
jgi:hypothetical protein